MNKLPIIALLVCALAVSGCTTSGKLPPFDPSVPAKYSSMLVIPAYVTVIMFDNTSVHWQGPASIRIPSREHVLFSDFDKPETDSSFGWTARAVGTSGVFERGKTYELTWHIDLGTRQVTMAVAEAEKTE